MYLLSSQGQCFQWRRRRNFPALSWAFSSLLFLFLFMSHGCEVTTGVRMSSLGGVNMTAEKRVDSGCSRDDVLVFQEATPPLPTGIPTYSVEVLNVCTTGCTIKDIHMSCGWFSSARLINPRLFRRLGYDDCLVNDGGGLHAGNSVTFAYANTYKYPLSVSSVSCNSE